MTASKARGMSLAVLLVDRAIHARNGGGVECYPSRDGLIGNDNGCSQGGTRAHPRQCLPWRRHDQTFLKSLVTGLTMFGSRTAFIHNVAISCLEEVCDYVGEKFRSG